jgi:DNA-binding CsgD family transcriptional regulator
VAVKTVRQQKLVVGDRAAMDLSWGAPIAKGDELHLSISRGTASPVVVSDDQWRIVALNQHAEQLLGCSSSDAAGRACHTLMRRRDRFGNHLPVEQYDVGSMVRRRESVHAFDVDLVAGDGDVGHAVCSVIVLHDGLECRIVHVLSLIADSNDDGTESLGSANAKAGLPRYGLTPRENDVLRLLARGNDCYRITELLFISLATVRNHVHNILRKMNVHSQVEAVAIAYRDRLV